MIGTTLFLVVGFLCDYWFPLSRWLRDKLYLVPVAVEFVFRKWEGARRGGSFLGFVIVFTCAGFWDLVRCIRFV